MKVQIYYAPTLTAAPHPSNPRGKIWEFRLEAFIVDPETRDRLIPEPKLTHCVDLEYDPRAGEPDDALRWQLESCAARMGKGFFKALVLEVLA